MTNIPLADDTVPNNEVIKWALQHLSSLGYSLESNAPETIQNTPWSYVSRFTTSTGYIYLKHTPELIALEPAVFQILREQFHGSVPNVIAHNAHLNCFLMEDAGTSLRVILKQKFDEALLCRVVDQFTTMQIKVADHVDAFLDIGVPDWRLDKLPHLLEQLLSLKDMLIEDGLSKNEIGKLASLLPTVANLCKKLETYSIKQTIVQPDFNDNNSLIDETSQDITMIDLGEIAISHPFFSLENFLHVIKKHHALTDTDAVYLRIKDTCLKNFMALESKKHIVEAFKIALPLFFIFSALAHHRLMVACEKSKFTSSFQRHGKPSTPLKQFLSMY